MVVLNNISGGLYYIHHITTYFQHHLSVCKSYNELLILTETKQHSFQVFLNAQITEIGLYNALEILAIFQEVEQWVLMNLKRNNVILIQLKIIK